MSDRTRPYRIERHAPAPRRERRSMVAEARADEVLDAVRRWNETYGEPPTLADWEPSRARSRGQAWRAERFEAGEWPTTRVVRYHFGTMSAAIAAAGLSARRRPTRTRPHLHSPDAIVDAIRAWVKRYGEPPGMADWDPQRARRAGHWWRVTRYYSRDSPSVTSVRHRFVALNAAIVRAGFEPRPRGRHARRPPALAAAAGASDHDAAAVLVRVRAVGFAQRGADRRSLELALRDLSSACLNWADRLAA